MAVADDTGTTDAATTTSGNVLANDTGTLTVVAVNGLSANVGVAVDGDNGGTFTIASDGSWTFDPSGDFASLSGADTATTSVGYHSSNGVAEAGATLTVTVSSADVQIEQDPYIQNVAMLINPDGTDGSTEIIDVCGATLNIGAGIAIDTDALGLPSILNTGANGITTSGTDWLPRGTEDFCIEAYIQKTAVTSGYEFFFDTKTTYGLGVYFGSVQGELRLTRTGIDVQLAISLSSIAVGTLYHIAFTRQGSTMKAWINGQQVKSATSSVSYANPADQRIMHNLKALCRGLRVTRGHHRYNVAFTPPTLPFPTL